MRFGIIFIVGTSSLADKAYSLQGLRELWAHEQLYHSRLLVYPQIKASGLSLSCVSGRVAVK